MTEYLSTLVFQVSIDGELPRFEEQTVLIRAQNSEEALLKSEMAGRKEDEWFLNAKQELVEWKYLACTSLVCLSSLDDLEIVSSRSLKDKDANSYPGFLKQKDMEIRIKNSNFV